MYTYVYEDYPDTMSIEIDEDESGYDLCFARIHEFYVTTLDPNGHPETIE